MCWRERMQRSYPANNFYPANFLQDIGFVDPANGDFRLSPSSPYKDRATDGGDPGVDFDALWANTAHDRSGIPETSMGDFNGDGTVDAADYVVWRKTDGTPLGYDTWWPTSAKRRAVLRPRAGLFLNPEPPCWCCSQLHTDS